MSGTVFGNVVYHNFQSTYGEQRSTALERFRAAANRFGVSE